jgi:tripartite-type tricarboxylate transporter receptor subunit TctC
MKPMLGALAGLALVLTAGAALAQTNYPERTIRIFVGFPTGGAPDLIARMLGEQFSDTWGQPVIIENVPGAGGNLATDRVAKAQPDGYTLLMAGNASLVINPNLYDKLPFDPVSDLDPVSQIFTAPNILVVHPNVPARTLPDLVALARAAPGELTFGSAGIGTTQHLAAEMFMSIEHLDIRHVPYGSTGGMLPDLLAARLTMSFSNIVNALPLVRGGRLRALAVTSPRRSPTAPEIPTMAESGYPGFDATAWFGLAAPAGTPRPIIEKLYRETVRAIEHPEVRRRFDELGLLPVGGTPDEMAGVIAAETPRWARLIKQTGIRISGE